MIFGSDHLPLIAAITLLAAACHGSNLLIMDWTASWRRRAPNGQAPGLRASLARGAAEARR
jgi:hypothetical protein